MTTKKTTQKSKTTGQAKKNTVAKRATKKVATDEARVYTQAGKDAGTVKLSEKIFLLPWNADMVHQVVLGMQANARQNIAHAKGRGEQRGGGRKPWRQKGTGRARHGSRRSPIWRGGGVTHGPTKERKFEKKINKKMRTKALLTALSQKRRDGEVLFVDTLSFGKPSARDARSVLEALSKIEGFSTVAAKKRNSAFIAIPERDANVVRSFKNFGNVEVDETRNLNPVDVLTYKCVVIVNPDESQKILAGRKQ